MRAGSSMARRMIPWTAYPLNRRQSLGDDLLSRAVARQVPSALSGLTAGFGMGPGGPLTHKSPRDCIHVLDRIAARGDGQPPAACQGGVEGQVLRIRWAKPSTISTSTRGPCSP